MTDTNHHRLVLKVLRALERRGTAARREIQDDLSQGGTTASEDQVRDALSALRDEGYATCSGTGRAAVWRAASSEATRTRALSDRLAFLFGQQHLRFAAGTRLVEPLDRALAADQVDELLPERLARKFHLIDEPARDYADQCEEVDRLIEALLGNRKVRFSWKDRGSLELEPLALVVYRRALYLVARQGPHDDEPRTYALDGVRRVEVGEVFAYPTRSTWDPERHFGPWFGVFIGKKRETFVFRFDADKAHLVKARTWHRSQEIVDLEDGRVELRLRSGGLELVRFAHEWGETVEVVGPAWFREKVRGNLGLALGRYGEG